MKNLLRLWCCVLMVIALPKLNYAQLSGNYTINPSGSGSSNYTSVSAAVSDLNSNGVNGAVTFTISSGTYTGQLIINSISGASATNTITFDGQDSSLTTIQYSGVSSSSTDPEGVIEFNGADYITFKNVTIKNTYSSSGYLSAVHFKPGATNNKIENCRIETNTSFNSLYDYYPIFMYQASDNRIENSIIEGGYMGAQIRGTSISTYNSNDNAITNCEFSNIYYYGVYNYYSSGTEIAGNIMDSLQTSGFIYHVYNYRSKSTEITGNRFLFTGSYGYGMYFYYENYYAGSSERSTVANNFVGGEYGNYARPLYLSSYSQDIDVLHNTHYIDYSSTSSYAFYISSWQTSGHKVKNNVFYQANSGSGYAMYIASANSVDSVDYNNVYSGGSNYAYFSGTRSSLSSLKGYSSSYNQNTYDHSLSFANARDVDLQDVNLNNKGQGGLGVTTDIFGETRPTFPDTKPDIGCNDYYLPPYDLDLVGIAAPSTFTVGNNTTSITVIGAGADSIIGDTAFLQFRLGTGSWTKDTFLIDTLTPGQTRTFTSSKNLSIPSAGEYTLCWSIYKNVSGDPDPVGESVCETKCTGVQGTVEIAKDGTGDYYTLQGAIDTLSCGGLIGALTIELKEGVYAETIVIDDMPGLSSTNTLTIKAMDGDDVTIRGTGSSSNYYAITVDGLEYINFKHLRVENSSSSYGAGILMYNGAEHITVDSCTIAMSESSTSSTHIGIGILGSANSSWQGGLNHNITVSNSTIRGGYYGVDAYGSGTGSASRQINIKLENNTFRQQYYYPVYLYYQDSVTVTGNDIDSLRNSSGGYGIYLRYGESDVVAYNRVNSPRYNLYMYRSNYYGATTDSSYVYNNMLSGHNYTFSAGFYLRDCYRSHVYYNSLYSKQSSTSTSYAAFYCYNSDNSRIINNIFACDNGGVVMYESASTFAAGDVDHNNYYFTNTSNPLYLAGSSYSSLSALQAGNNTQNINSIAEDPSFTAENDLHTNSPLLNNKGMPLAQVKDDYDRETRPVSPDNIPDIGADDYYLPPYDLDIVAINPSVFATGNNSVSIVLQNNGINPIVNDTAYISYRKDNGSWIADSFIFNGSFAIGNDTSITFQTPLSISSGTSGFNLCTRVDSGITGDPDSPDEYCVSACVGLADTFDINPDGTGDFTSFSDAIDTLNGCGVTGNVIFNVANGTYNEQVIIPQVNGTGPNARIFFLGESLTGVILKYSGTSSSYPTLAFDDADYFVIKNITVQNTNTSNYSTAVQFLNGADSNIVEGCKLEGFAKSSSSWTSRTVLASSSVNNVSSQTTASNNVLKDNDIRGGYYTIQLSGAVNTLIEGNEIKEGYYFAGYDYYTSGTRYVGNTIDSITSSSGRGIYNYYANGNTFDRNIFSGYGAYGIYFSRTNYNSSDSSVIKNNWFLESNASNYRQVYITFSSENVYVLHNSFYSNSSTTSTSYPQLYSSSTDNLVVQNNVFQHANSGYTMYINSGSNEQIDYNCYYRSSAFRLAYDGGQRNTLSDWQSAVSGQNANSFEADPKFTSTTDLHTRASALNNKATALYPVTTDVDGDTRPFAPDTVPDIGSDEYYLPPIDIDIVDITTDKLVIGANTVNIDLINNGTDTLDSDTIYLEYSVGGGTAVKDTLITGKVGPGSTMSFNFDDAYSESGGVVSREICVKVNPAFKTDPDTTSDELCENICVSASGTYVVDPSGNEDFESVEEAMDYLNCAGIHGAVTVRINAGVYSASHMLNNIDGASATNTIRFVGRGNASHLTHNGSFGDMATVILDGTKHLTLDSLKISGAHQTYAVAVQFKNQADSNTISNSTLANSTTTTSTRNAVIAFSSSTSSNTSSGDNGNYNSIVNNRIVGGYYGIALRGSSTSNRITNNSIRENDFRSQYYYGLYSYYAEGSQIVQNDFDSLRSTSGRSINFEWGDGNDIIRNKIQSGQYGIRLRYENYSSSSDTGIVVNNMVSNLSNSSIQYGIYLYYADKESVLHNSVWCDGSSTSASYPAFELNNSDNCVVKNNIFAATNGGYTFYRRSGTIPSGSIDYNDYYAPNSSNHIYWSGSTYSSVTAWNAAVTSENGNSIESNPGFISESNLHSFSDSVNNKGDNANSWPTDYDGDARPTSPDNTVDIGADDFWIPLYDLDLLSVDSPALLRIGGNTVSATFQNRGLRKLVDDTAVVSYSVNGGTAVVDTIFIDSIAVGDDTTFNFNTSWNVTASGSYNLCVSVDTLLGGERDTLDDLCMTICAGVGDTIYVAADGTGDYTTIQGALNRLSCGVYGPTVVMVKAGTYNEAVEITDYTGMNATNWVKIVGEHKDSVIWKPRSSSDNHTIKFDGANYFTLENLTIRNMNTSNITAYVVGFTNGSKVITINNCNLEASNTVSSSSGNVIRASSNLPGAGTGNNADSVTISNSSIRGGYYGIYLQGSSSFTRDDHNRVMNCTFRDQYFSGAMLYYQEDAVFADNDIDSMRAVSPYGMLDYFCVSTSTYNNKVKSDYLGIYRYYNNYYGSVGDSSFVYNNHVYITGGGFNDRAPIYNYRCDENMFYHNTLISTATTTTSSAAALFLFDCDYFEVKNNILYTENGGYLFYQSSGTHSSGAIDNNNYYAESTFRAYHNFGFHSSFASWRSSQTGHNTNSHDVNPYLVSFNDIHSGAIELRNGGADVGIDTDFEGDTRHASMPDIGADEIIKDLALTEVLEPVNACRLPSASDSVKVKLENAGVSAITPGDSAMITYTIGATSYTDTVVIPGGSVMWPGSSQDLTLSNKISSGSAGNNTVAAWAKMVDGSNADNDSAQTTFHTNPLPVASFTVADQCEYETSSFISTSTISLGGIASYAWTFGDGNSDTGDKPTHDYGVYDTFNVKLIVTSDSGCVDTTDGIAVTHPRPVAGYSTTNVCHHKQADFTNSSAVAYGTLSYSWDFGDNSSTSTAEDPSLTYANDGNYQVQLVATSDQSCRDTVSKSITVYPTPDPAITNAEVCDKDAASFVDATTITSGSYTVRWDFGDGNTSTSSNPSHTYGSPGSYTVELLAQTSNGCADSVDATQIVNPLPTSSFNATNMCYGDTMKPTDLSSVPSGSITGWLWYFDDGNTSTSSAPSHVYASSGTYTVSLVVTTNNGCKDSSTQSVTVATQPQADFTFNDDCVHNTFTFTNATSVACGNVSSYRWNYGDGTVETYSTASDPDHLYTNPGTYNVQLLITLANGVKDSITKQVTVYQQPTAAFSYSAACEGQLMQFTSTSSAVSGTSLSSYAWTFGDGGSSALRNPTNTYSSSATYNVVMVLTDSRSCKDTVLNRVSVNPNPDANFSYVKACAEDTVSFTNSSSISSGSLNYNWDFGDNTSGTVSDPNKVYSNDGFFSVKLVAASNAGCKDSITKTVEVYSLPTSLFNTSAVCLNEASSFNNQSSGATSYNWNFGDGSGTSTASNPSYTYGSSGNYRVQLVATSSKGCLDTSTATATVNSLPTAAFSASDVCDGDAVNFSNSSSGASSYSWSYGDGAGSNVASPKHTYAGDGSYSVELIAISSASCRDTTTSTVTVNALPTISFSASNQCLGTAISFSNSTTGASSYSWSFGDGNNSTSSTPSHNYSSAGTYKVVLTATSSNNCVSKDSMMVTVYPVPSAAISASTVCEGTATAFTNSSSISSGSMTYSWDFGDNNGTSSNTSPSYTYGSDGSYTVEMIATSGNGCRDTATTTATVNANPAASFTASNVCDGQAMSFTNNSTGASSYSWDFGDGNSSSSSAPSHTYNSDGNYTVTLTATSAAGCDDQTSRSVRVYSLPTPNFSVNDVCVGNSISPTNLSTNASSYSWDFGDGNSSSSASPTHTYSSAGSYTITLIATSSNNCVDSIKRTVTINALPSPAFTATTECEGVATSFTNNSTGAASYSWDFGDGMSSVIANPGHRYANDGSYSVTLTATSTAGCSDDVTNTVTVNEQPDAAYSATTTCAEDTTFFTNSSSGTIASYRWEFGDGNGATTANASNVYARGGNYSVELLVSTAEGCRDSLTTSVRVLQKPTSGFSVSNVCLDADAMFMDASSGSIINREWLFGDGNNSFNRSPSHRYAVADTYTVALVTTSVDGCTDTVRNDVTIHPLPELNYSINDTCAGLEAVVTNNSTIKSGMIADWMWDFNDGFISTATAPGHAYSTYGSFAVEVTATSDLGCTSNSTTPIRIYANPENNFQVDEVCTGDTSWFMDMSTIDEGSIVGWNWEFGDDSTSTEATTTHLYDSAALYDLVLTTTSDWGCTDSDTLAYEVHAQPEAMIVFEANPICAFDSIRVPASVRNQMNMDWTYAFYTALGDTLNTLPEAYQYPEAGDYELILTIETPFGCFDSTSSLLMVNPLPEVEWTYVHKTNRRILFDAESATGIDYLWDFGDGNTSTDTMPEHQYGESGEFYATLVVTDANGCEGTYSDTVDVAPISIEETAEIFFMDAYPNPFREWTKLQYELKDRSYVRVEIFDLQGRVISKVFEGSQPAGLQQFILNDADLNSAAGQMMVRVIVNDEVYNLNLIQLR